MIHECDLISFFFFNDTATTEIYTLSLHDALPISELGGPGAHDDVGDRARLLTLHDETLGGLRVPDVADDPGPELSGKARPHDVELGGLVVRVFAARVGALRQGDDPPAPLEDRRRLEVDLHLLGDHRTVALAPEVQHAVAVVLFDREVVLREAPRLAAGPAVGNALGAERELRPVLDDDHVGRPRRGDEEEGRGQAEGPRGSRGGPPGHGRPYDTVWA